jgi:hypothetical protein
VRQLARVSVVNYRETLWSDLFPGNFSTMQCLQPAVLNVETSFDLAKWQRKRVLYRLDGGSGTDKNLTWLLKRGYQVLSKGFSGRRARALANHVSRWDPYAEDRWIGWVEPTFDLGRPVKVLLKRKWHQDGFKYSYYVTTLTFPSKRALMRCYDQRGAAEIEQFRNDKGGLYMSARRKQRMMAQKALILLTDLAHNLLADFHNQALVGSPFENWGLKRIVRDLLHVPGRLRFQSGQLKRIELLAAHPYADALIICLERYCSGRFSNRNGLCLHDLC